MVAMKRLFLLISILFFSITGLFAQNSFKAVGPSNIGVGERFKVVYTIDSRDISSFSHPNFGGLERLAGPSQSTSSSTQVINGVVSSTSSVSFTYVLVSNKEGDFEISPAKIRVSGKEIESNSLRIKVSQNPSQSQRSQYQGRPQRQPSFQDNNVSELDNKSLFIRASANKSSVYLGQEVIITYKLYTLVPVSEFEVNQMPINQGFWIEELDMSRDPIITEERLDGKVYQVATLRKVIAYPQTTGNLTIHPLDIDATAMVKSRRSRRVSTGDPFFDSFFNDPFFQSMQSGYERVKKNLKSNSINIDVKPLPQTDKYFSGGVGDFNLESKISSNKAKTNEAITLTYTISGKGNLSLIDGINLSIPEEFESYDPSILDNINKTASGMSGSRSFEYILIPRVEGKARIPELEFTFFDIKSNTYKTLYADEIEFEIEKGSAISNAYEKQGSERDYYKNKDIEFINLRGLKPIRPNQLSFFHPFFYISILAILLIGILFVFLYNRRAESRKDIVNLRYKAARKVANRRFRKAKQYLKQGSKDEFYDEVAKAVWNYLLDRFKIEKAELTFENVEERLREKGIREPIIENLVQLLNRCEFVRFAPGEEEEKMDTLYEESINTISEIESEIKN